MNFRKLGNSGLIVSEIGLGCNNFGMVMNQKQTNNVVSSAIDEGITLFDTADVYGNKGKSEIFMELSVTIFVKITSAVGIKNFLLSPSNFISN